MKLYDILNKRKSVRKFLTKKVEPEKIEQIMTAAQIAPSWRNGQCWKFIVVQKPEIKKLLIKLTGTFNQSWLGKEDAIIVACGQPEKSGNRDEKAYYLVDVAIAMEHLVLAATELGLGTCWLGAFDENKIKNLLSIPDDYKIVALTPLGYPAESEGVVGKIARTVAKSKYRKPLSEVYTMNGWE